MKISASAPGKLVVSGEYAVLLGAPGLALAIDRRMCCTVTDSSPGAWHFHATGFESRARHSLDTLTHGAPLPANDPARLCQHVVQALLEDGVAVEALAPALSIELDSSAGYYQDRKLGVGSSAAICVALTAALLRLADAHRDPFPIAQRAHAGVQHGRGSGIDIAAACSGGLVRYARTTTGADIRPLPLPSTLHYRAIWTGASAATSDYLARFDAWRGAAIPTPLAALLDAAHTVADALPDVGRFMRELRAYADALRHFDRAAGLGIYSAQHRTLADLATRHDVVYKPCGAGGGDFGMAFADPDAATRLEAFATAAQRARFTPMSLELDPHGITVGIER